MWLANKFNLVSKIGFYIFAIIFVFNALNLIKTLYLTVVCVSNPRQSSTIKNRYMLAGALRIAENLVFYLLLSLLCSTLYGKSLIMLIKHTF